MAPINRDPEADRPLLSPPPVVSSVSTLHSSTVEVLSLSLSAAVLNAAVPLALAVQVALLGMAEESRRVKCGRRVKLSGIL